MISARTPAEELNGSDLLTRITDMILFYNSTFVNQDDEQIRGFIKKLRVHATLLQDHGVDLEKIPPLELRTIYSTVNKPLTLCSFSPEATPRKTKITNKTASLRANPTVNAELSDTSISAYTEKSELDNVGGRANLKLNPNNLLKGVMSDVDEIIGIKTNMIQFCLMQISQLKTIITSYEVKNAKLSEVSEMYKAKNSLLTSLCDLRNTESVQLKKLHASAKECLAKAMKKEANSEKIYMGMVVNYNSLKANHETLSEAYRKSIELSDGLQEMLDWTTEDNEKNKVELMQQKKVIDNLALQRDEIYYVLHALVTRAKIKSFKLIEEEINFIIKMVHIQMCFLDIELPLAGELHNVTGRLLHIDEKSPLLNSFDFYAYKHQCIGIISKALPSIDKEMYSRIYNLALGVLETNVRSMRTDFKFFSSTMNLPQEQERDEVRVFRGLQ